MGFLNHSTNNIILDCVLTDKGREALARNDGSFSIVKFAPGDDEVDYTLIQKFGRTVGKEKIEKNTPILEALTNQSYAQKFRLVSVSNPNLIRLATLEITGEGVTSASRIVAIGNTTVKRRSITVAQSITNETSIDVELRDQSFLVELSNQFLQIVGSSPVSIDSKQRATYILTRDAGETSVGGSRVSFTISTKSITESEFQIYGASSNKSLISTFAKVTGVSSGAVIELEIQVTKES